MAWRRDKIKLPCPDKHKFTHPEKFTQQGLNKVYYFWQKIRRKQKKHSMFNKKTYLSENLSLAVGLFLNNTQN